jgi:hypothetical protein
MMTTTRTASTPYCAIDPLTNEYLGWYDTMTAAQIAHPTAFHYFRPKRTRVKS